MPGLAIAALVAYLLVAVVVLVVRLHVARSVRLADAPLDGEELRHSDEAPSLDARLLTGAELARRLLDDQGLEVVHVVAADVDAYRAVTREIQLADGREARASVAAWAIAAHEVGHATQHRTGDTAWKRWWVLSGHTTWAVPVLFLLLVIELVLQSPIVAVLAGLCALVLITCALLSWRVERTATETARELLLGAGLPPDAVALATRLLRLTAAGYIAESLIDFGFIDRIVEPYRGFAVGGGGSAG